MNTPEADNYEWQYMNMCESSVSDREVDPYNDDYDYSKLNNDKEENEPCQSAQEQNVGVI